jgi:predicted HicB family RNase H-like nuclease
MAKKKMDTQLNIRVSISLYEAIAEKAKEKHISMAELVRQLITKEIEKCYQKIDH